MDVSNYCNRPAVRLAGCILLLLLILSHGPVVVLQPTSLPITLLRILVIASAILLYIINTSPGVFLNLVIILWRNIQPWNQTMDQWTRTILNSLSSYVALPELTKDIVFAYSVAMLYDEQENKYIFAWVISLLGNYCLSMSVAMILSRNLSILKYFALILVSGLCLTTSVRHYSFLYTASVLIYHCSILEWIVNSFIITIKTLDLDVFEGMEKFYVWIFVHTLQLILGVSHAVLLLLNVDGHFLSVTLFAPVILLCYIVCYPSLVGLVKTSSILHQYYRKLSYFPKAKTEEMDEVRSDVCAVCLSSMDSARTTPCQHHFHGKCLLRCLRHRPTCPMCKTVFDIPK